MKNYSKNRTQLLLLIMMTVSLAVTAALMGRAAAAERKASDLSRAVLLAQSAADAFYEASYPEEYSRLMELVDRPEGLELNVSGASLVECSERISGWYIEAVDISVERGSEEIFALHCEKLTDRPVFSVDGQGVKP